MANRIRSRAAFLAGTMILLGGSVERVWAQLPAQSKELGTCPSPISVEIAEHREPVTIRTDFRLNEIMAQAARAGKSPAHRPLGFYLGRVAYKINWHEARSRIHGCPAVIRISASVALIDRQIEIGRELVADPCLYERALLHYTKHASVDEATVNQFVDRLKVALNEPMAKPDGSDHARQADEIEKSMRIVIDRALQRLDNMRATSQKSVDTPEQIQLMNAQTCHSSS